MLCVVKRSKNASLIGLEGIIVVETAETFKIVTTENVVKSTSASYVRCLQLTGLSQSYPNRTPSSPSPSQPTPSLPSPTRHPPHNPPLQLFSISFVEYPRYKLTFSARHSGSVPRIERDESSSMVRVEVDGVRSG